MKFDKFPVLLFTIILLIIINFSFHVYKTNQESASHIAKFIASEKIDTVWRGWNKYQIKTADAEGKLIWYGYQLIVNTAYYLGPKGIVVQTTNGMNCQNCHLDGGTVPYANNFGKVYATYPQFSFRSNQLQTIYGRINDCLQRSLNGRAMDSTILEMRAIFAYIKWIGGDVPKGVALGGTSTVNLQYLNRSTNIYLGKKCYINNCQSCHGNNGQGKLDSLGDVYIYPPLWGEHSYNDGAGMYRLSRFAGFVKNNMPFGTDYHDPKLTDEESWDVAAFVNSQPRPHKNQTEDWQNLTKKPIDFPFGPYIDSFSVKQHKFGCFTAIQNFTKTNK